MRTKAEDLPLDPNLEKGLRQLPVYWRLIQNNHASRKLMCDRIRALVFLAQGLEARLDLFKVRIARLKHENEVLHDEIASLRRRRIAKYKPAKAKGPRARTRGPMKEPPMIDVHSTPPAVAGNRGV